jgi:hypothetical protein
MIMTTRQLLSIVLSSILFRNPMTLGQWWVPGPLRRRCCPGSRLLSGLPPPDLRRCTEGGGGGGGAALSPPRLVRGAKRSGRGCGAPR